MQNPIHAWAMAYFDAGWCVVPAINKRTIVEWKVFNDTKKYPTIEQTSEWFIDAPANAQIALLTGFASKVTVIDVDTHGEACKSKKGGVCDCMPLPVDDLVCKIGLTMTSVSGSGGKHLFCNYAPGVTNSAKRLHPQIDIRGERGIIILPPSLHANGNLYAWDKLLPFSQFNLKNLMDFPEEWKAKLKEKNNTDWNSVIGHGVGSGSRNATLASVVGKLVRTFDRDHLTAAWDMAYMWNQRNNPPLSDSEFEKTFQSILNKHYGK